MTRGTAPSYQGFYINLDRSVLRDQRMQAQLTALGLTDRYTRLPAIDGTALNRASGIGTGETGAFLSHARALELAQALGLPVHVLEDDALLSEHIAPVIADAIAAGLFENFDILFTDIFVNAHLGMLKGLKAAFDRTAPPLSRPLRLADLQVLDLARENFACMTSYIVGAKSLDRILALYRAELEKGPTKPVDLFLRDCVFEGACALGFCFPSSPVFGWTRSPPARSRRGSQIANPSVMVLAVLRYLFFVGRDLGYAKACLDAATKQNRRETDPHNAMMAQALEFVLSADFQQF